MATEKEDLGKTTGGLDGETFTFLNNPSIKFNLEDTKVVLMFVGAFFENSSFEKTLETEAEFSKLMDYTLHVINSHETLNSQGEGEDDIRNFAFSAFTNLAGKSSTSSRMIDHPNFVETMKSYWFPEKDSDVTQCAVAALVNLTQEFNNATKFLDLHPDSVTKAVQHSTWVYNVKNHSSEFYVKFLCNVTQTVKGRSMMLDEEQLLLPRLFIFMDQTKFSLVFRIAMAGILKNCCMELESHAWLLTEDIDILSTLLLPLAGPEEFTEEDYSKMPASLQYLPNDKEREPNGSIRKTLLEALFKLCQRRTSREILRENNVYYILREYHLWEPDEDIKAYLEEIINVIVRTEDEIGLDDLSSVHIDQETKN